MRAGKNNILKRDPLNNSDRMEMLGCFIDIFEDWLEEKGITADDIPNPEREENEMDFDGENEVIIYGSDYDLLTSQIESVLVRTGILNMKCSSTGEECQMCTKECSNRY